MSMIVATLGSVPVSGFDWYVLFTEPTLGGGKLSKQVNKFFVTFGREDGQRTLAVRGYNKAQFRASIVEAAVDFYKLPLVIPDNEPVIIVTNAISKKDPKKDPKTEADVVNAKDDFPDLASSKVMLFPLGKIYKKDNEDL